MINIVKDLFAFTGWLLLAAFSVFVALWPLWLALAAIKYLVS